MTNPKGILNNTILGEKIYEPPVEEEEFEEEEVEEEETEEGHTRKRKIVVPSEPSIVDSSTKSVIRLPSDPKILAIMLIQAHERARQYRLEYLDERTLYEYR